MLTVRDPVRTLRQFLEDRRAHAFRANDAAYVVQTISREILPVRGLSGLCAQLDLFADWSAHGELDRQPTGQRAIAAIAEAIPLHGRDGNDNKWLEEVVNGNVSFRTLRLELLAICREFQLGAVPDLLTENKARSIGYAT